MNVMVMSTEANYNSFLKKKLSSETVNISEECNMDNALLQLKKEHFDGIICCLPLLSLTDPFEVTKLIQSAAPRTRIIFISDNIQLHNAMDLMRLGVFSCFNRPFPLEDLTNILPKLAAELRTSEATRTKTSEATTKRAAAIPSEKYVRGISVEATTMYQQIDLVGPTNFSVIIYGETGTGKESVAYRVANARGAAKPYIAVDCGCLSKELALSELFGHEVGSFTGAVNKKVGAFELANNGTLFLDEIGNLDYEVQGFLLRAIQERKIRRVGSVKDIDINTRIIVASNENLSEAVKEGRFREDLYHRLNEFQITVPPLRKRTNDLPLFIERFLNETNMELGKNVGVPDPATMSFLMDYKWPGNIRELRNAMRRACLICPDGNAVTMDYLPTEIIEDAENDMEEALRPVNNTAPSKPKELTPDSIREILIQVNHNKSKAAQILGIDRKTIYNILKRDILRSSAN